MPPLRQTRSSRAEDIDSSSEDGYGMRRIRRKQDKDRVSPKPRFERYCRQDFGTPSEPEQNSSATMSEDNEQPQLESFIRSSRGESFELQIIDKAEFKRNVHNTRRRHKLDQSLPKTTPMEPSRSDLPPSKDDSPVHIRGSDSSDAMELSSRPPSRATSARSPSPAIQLDAMLTKDPMRLSSRGSSPEFMLHDKYPGILQALSELGYPGLRERQIEAVEATLEDRDVVVRLATGAGKTLVVLLPAYYRRDGLTVVVVPTLSLLRQHVLAMIEKNILVVAFCSGISPDCKRNFHALLLSSDAASCRLPLFVFVTPEQMWDTDFRHTLQTLHGRGLLSRFVIDEAHLMLEWSSFRTAYSGLKAIRVLYPDIPITALSATLSGAHIQWLADNLQLEPDTQYVLGTLNRANICYEVIHCRKEKALETLISFIEDNCLSQSIIIYCATTRDCKKVLAELQSKSLCCVMYLGTEQMSSVEQSTAAHRWDTGKVDIVVATTAFGYGINKADVRYILHYGAPLSFNDWVQKSGRAGRDGRACHDVVFYSPTDLEMHLKLAAANIQSEDYPLQCSVESVREVHRLCLSPSVCIRTAVLQSMELVDCASQPSALKCSNCRSNSLGQIVDASPFVSAVVAAVDAWNESIRHTSPTATKLAKVVTGADVNDVGVRDLRVTRPELFGTAKTLVCAEGTFTLNQPRARDLINMLTAVGIFHLTYFPGIHNRSGWVALSANPQAVDAIKAGQAVELWLPSEMFDAVRHKAPGICLEYETSGAEADSDSEVEILSRQQ